MLLSLTLHAQVEKANPDRLSKSVLARQDCTTQDGAYLGSQTIPEAIEERMPATPLLPRNSSDSSIGSQNVESQVNQSGEDVPEVVRKAASPRRRRMILIAAGVSVVLLIVAIALAIAIPLSASTSSGPGVYEFYCSIFVTPE